MRFLQKNCCRREWRGLSNFGRLAKDLQGTRKRPRVRGPTRRRSIRHICACPVLPKSHLLYQSSKPVRRIHEKLIRCHGGGSVTHSQEWMQFDGIPSLANISPLSFLLEYASALIRERSLF